MYKQHDVTVFSLTTNGEIGKHLAAAGISVKALHCTPLTAVSRLRKEFRQYKPDIVHAFLWHANMTSRFAAIGLPCTVVCSIRFRELSFLRRLADKATGFLVDHFTVNSPALIPYAGSPCMVVYNGVPATFVRSIVRKTKPKTAVMIAHFRPEKDHETVLAVAATRPDWNFQLLGGGQRRQFMQEQARVQGLKNVAFVGPVPDVRPYLSSATCLIHFSLSEGMPNAVIEAMLLGVPIIASDIPENRALVRGRGILVAVQDSKGASAALDHLPSAAVVRRAQLWARQTFAESTMREAYRELYSRLGTQGL